MSGKPWSDSDRELVARTWWGDSYDASQDEYALRRAEAVLDALTAAGWEAEPATPAEALDLDAIEADLYEASNIIDHPDAPYNWAALSAMRTAERLLAELRRARELIAERGRLEEIGDDLREQLILQGAVRALVFAAGFFGDPASLLSNYAAELLSGKQKLPKEIGEPGSTVPGPAPTTWALPDPPAAGITEVWDVEGVRWERQYPGIDRWVADEAAVFESVRTWGVLLRRGPLSSVPPGTEAGHG